MAAVTFTSLRFFEYFAVSRCENCRRESRRIHVQGTAFSGRYFPREIALEFVRLFFLGFDHDQCDPAIQKELLKNRIDFDQRLHHLSRRIDDRQQAEGFVIWLIQLQWEAYSRLKEPEVKGEIRFGTPEDFATHSLPNVLASFRQHHPRVQLNVACDLTLNNHDGFRKEFTRSAKKPDYLIWRMLKLPS